MSACVFLGPTLAVSDAATFIDATFLPPVQLGDVHRAVSERRPSAIGIVDGYFQWAPAVWHKEVLWAIDQGVHVFGAASMGALRAAELAPFGMRGVGRIFTAYRDGHLDGMNEPFEDDDEVAVVHGPPESGYRGASEAMVDIRCTLMQAARNGVIAEGTRRALVTGAKAMFFPDRRYPAVLARGRADGLPEPELAALERWLPSCRVHQKRRDALAMLEAMREFLAADPPPARAQFDFQRTTHWETAEADWRKAAEPAPATVLKSLRLDVADCEHLGEEELCNWYFTHVVGTSIPTDLVGWTRGAGYTDPNMFLRQVFAEYLERAPDQGARP